MAAVCRHDNQIALLALGHIHDGLLDVVRDHELTIERDASLLGLICKLLQHRAGVLLTALVVLFEGFYIVGPRQLGPPPKQAMAARP